MDLKPIKRAASTIANISNLFTFYLFIKYGFQDITTVLFIIAAILDIAYIILSFAIKNQNLFQCKKAIYDYILIFMISILLIYISFYITTLVMSYDIQFVYPASTIVDLFSLFIILSSPNLLIVIIYYLRFSYLNFKPIFYLVSGSSILGYLFLIVNSYFKPFFVTNFINFIFILILSPILLPVIFGAPIAASIYILMIPLNDQMNNKKLK